MLTDELDYTLPDRLIATEPARPRDAARLMLIDRATDRVAHHRVRDLPDLGVFKPGDLLVFNQTRVVPAYFEAVRSATGGHVTGLYLASPQADHWEVLLESRGKLREGEWLHFRQGARLELLVRQGNGQWLARCESDLPTMALLEQVGTPPLPPYIRRQRAALGLPAIGQADVERYNTVYAQEAGSVAAPTAGLHFTPELLARLDALGVRRAMVTLHVGLGTFAPIRTDRVEDHPIHQEHGRVSADTLAAIAHTRAIGGRVIPVGTTTVRTLESLPDPLPDAARGQVAFSTQLYIHPGKVEQGAFAFRFTDRLMTNFHLPRSSLLAMVASLPGVGLPRLRGWYAQAIAADYRFYSYGDAMLLA